MASPVLQADCKKAVQSLSSLNNEELDKIMNDDDQIENILAALDQSYVKEIQNQKETLIAENSSLAEENLSKEPELVEGREQLQKLNDQAEELSKKVEEKLKELRKKSGELSLETSLALLQTAASEMEEESDKFVKNFLDHEMELDSFLEEFLTKRKTVHLRLIKAEKLSKLLSQDPLDNTNYINAPPVNINSNYFPTPSVPYPTGPIGMPMPGVNFYQNHF